MMYPTGANYSAQPKQLYQGIVSRASSNGKTATRQDLQQYGQRFSPSSQIGGAVGNMLANFNTLAHQDVVGNPSFFADPRTVSLTDIDRLDANRDHQITGSDFQQARQKLNQGNHGGGQTGGSDVKQLLVKLLTLLLPHLTQGNQPY